MATTQLNSLASAKNADRRAYLQRISIRILIYSVLILLSIIALAPFFFAISGSLMAQGEIF
jgi:ABC-type glycerol-3-phosphate transport system permease component